MLVLVAATAPVLAGAAVRDVRVVYVVGLAVSAGGAFHGWVSYRAWVRSDVLIVVALAATCAISDPIFGLWTLLGGLCSAALLRSRGISMPWLTWGAGRQWAGFGAAVPAGVALGGLNLLMARASSDSARAGGRLDGLLDAVRAGVAEELGIRLCLLALCIYLIGRLPRTRLEQVLTYLVMVVPHAALHFVTMPTQLLAGTIILGAVFGLPFAILLKRFGVAPAIAAHTLVDGIRLLALGS